MNFLKKTTIFFYINIILSQLAIYEEPLSKKHPINTNLIDIYSFDEVIQLECIQTPTNQTICQAAVEFNTKKPYSLELNINNSLNKSKIFIIDYNDKNLFKGPYDIINNKVISKQINSNSIIIELNTNKYIETAKIELKIIPNQKQKLYKQKNTFYKKNQLREQPIILLTGYWPPTNEMIRHFSQNDTLNPEGWQGENWEDRGFDIISYFPEFSDPDCSSCGQGYGNLEVDYQDTSEDFWPIFEEHRPIATITFSRGFMDQSWELEYNAYNRTNWYNDFTSPFQPTPNPPDTNEDAFFLRNSNLPMEQIVEGISELNIGLNPYIDINGDPGRYVSEFMAYHGTWYRDLNQFSDTQCISGGHIHVGGFIDWNTARIATEESIRILINYLNSFIYTPGDLNQDEIIDILDLVTIVNFILGDISFTDLQMYAGDINEDSIINIQDIIIIINLILSN